MHAKILGLDKKLDVVKVEVTDDEGLKYFVMIPRPADGKFPSSENILKAAKAIVKGRQQSPRFINPRTYERGRDYGKPRQMMRSKKFEPGDRVRFKSDKSLGIVTRAGAHSLTVRDDNGDSWNVTTAEIVHSAAVKSGYRNAGAGYRVTFHGMFRTKAEAVKKERAVPGSFIQQKDGYYFVLRPKPGAKNPGRVKIYGRCLRIEAIKTVDHTYGGKPTGAGQRYFHDFTTKNAKIYGLPNGDLLISAR